MAKNILLDLKNTKENENLMTNPILEQLEQKLTQKIILSNLSNKNSSNFDVFAVNYDFKEFDDQLRSSASDVNEEYIKAIKLATEKS